MQNPDLFRLDAHALRVFVSVCETQSVSQTAGIFEVNQSTISHTIEKVRSAVGDPLFVKSGRGITPTDTALTILPRVQQIIADIEGLVAPSSYDISEDTRPIAIAISTPALLQDMRRLHSKALEVAPQSRFELHRLAPRNKLTEILTSGEAELAITVSGGRYPAALNHCTYDKEALAVFYDPRHRGPLTSAEDYVEAKHGVVNFGGGVQSQVEIALEGLGLKRNVVLVAPTASMLGDLIKGTDIIATMPERLGGAVYGGLAKSPPPISLPPICYDLVWHRRYEHSGRNILLRNLVLGARSGEDVQPSTAV